LISIKKNLIKNYRKPKIKKENPSLLEYRHVIEEVIRHLPNGESRLTVSEYPFPVSHCLHGFGNPDLADREISDRSTSQGDKEIEKDYYEEIHAIEKALLEANVPIRLADWQKADRKINDQYQADMSKLFTQSNRRSYAMQLWDGYGIPWRFKDDFIHIIWSPKDVFGAPIISGWPVDDFLKLLIRINIEKARDFASITQKYQRWLKIGSVGIGFVCFLASILLVCLWSFIIRKIS